MPAPTAGDSKQPNVVLTGFMGTGKTTTGRILAERLGLRFVDTDQLIEDRHGPIASIFAESGEAAFRDIERQVAAELGAQSDMLISTGGRMLLDRANEQSLTANGVVVCLSAPADVIVERVLADADGPVRPLLAGPDPAGTITSLLNERASGYGRFVQVDTNGHAPAAVADSIIAGLPAWSSTVVRPATDADVGRVADLLADAFDGYEFTNWALPAEDHATRLRTLYEIHSHIGVHRGDLWVLEAGGQIVSAAAWSLLDGSAAEPATYRGVPDALLERARTELPPLFGDQLAAVQAAEEATLGHRPSSPYWFLDCLGTDPAHGQRAHGSTLIGNVIARLAADRLPMVLETSSERNVAFYERLGFGVSARVDLGEGAPAVWVMIRQASDQ